MRNQVGNACEYVKDKSMTILLYFSNTLLINLKDWFEEFFRSFKSLKNFSI